MNQTEEHSTPEEEREPLPEYHPHPDAGQLAEDIEPGARLLNTLDFPETFDVTQKDTLIAYLTNWRNDQHRKENELAKRERELRPKEKELMRREREIERQKLALEKRERDLKELEQMKLNMPELKTEEDVQGFLGGIQDDLIASLTFLAKNASSEKLRSDSARYLLDRLHGKAGTMKKKDSSTEVGSVIIQADRFRKERKPDGH